MADMFSPAGKSEGHPNGAGASAAADENKSRDRAAPDNRRSGEEAVTPGLISIPSTAVDIPEFAFQLARRATQVTDPEDPENSSDAPQGGSQNEISITIDPSNVSRALLTVALFTLSMAMVTVFYKAPTGVVFGHHRLAYYLSLAAIIVAGVAEAWAALWILGSCQTDRRRFGKCVLWASIVPLVTVMGIGGFAFFRA